MQKSNNIFAEIPTTAMEEIVEELVRSKSVRIERIVSTGQITPEDYWYDQDQNEWVIVLKGKAQLLFQTTDQTVSLQAGDYIHIPAHVKHRVTWTSPNEPTIWLAVFYE
ncbi:MAG: DUF1255 family protein [Phycisphaerae bacterium]|nr:DUF1255 family protein [Phycisphaerae bacterium]